jgi:hypothetical protein
VAASLVLAVVDGLTVQSILDVDVQINDALIAGLKRAILKALMSPMEPPIVAAGPNAHPHAAMKGVPPQ